MRILIECGGSSRWVARLLRELGHQVVVVNPWRRVAATLPPNHAAPASQLRSG
jgi:hypothetical protein